MVRCRASQPPAWSNWPLSVDDDAHLTGVEPAALTHGHTDPDNVISSLYARMLIADTSRTTPRDDFWSADVGLLPGCRRLGVGGSLSDTESFGPCGDGGGDGTLLYDRDGGSDNNNDAPWNALFGFFDDDLSARRLRAGLGAAAGDDSAGPWRLRPPPPDFDVSAVLLVGSDGATSPSYSPAESSTGSAT